MKDSTTGVVLPDDGIIGTAWAAEQLGRVNLFSQELLNYGKGEIFFMLQTNLSPGAFEQSIKELEYTVETALVYINYLQIRPVLEAIKERYYVAVSLDASRYLLDAIEDSLALCDVCVARYGKITAENLRKASEDTGQGVKKMSDAAIGIEAMKKKALNEWLLESHGLTESDVMDAQRLHPEGRTEFTEKMVAAFDRLDDWKVIYGLIAKPIHDSDNPEALRFLADLNDAAPSMVEFLDAEEAHQNLNALKEKFESEVYPEISFEASK